MGAKMAQEPTQKTKTLIPSSARYFTNAAVYTSDIIDL